MHRHNPQQKQDSRARVAADPPVQLRQLPCGCVSQRLSVYPYRGPKTPQCRSLQPHQQDPPDQTRKSGPSITFLQRERRIVVFMPGNDRHSELRTHMTNSDATNSQNPTRGKASPATQTSQMDIIANFPSECFPVSSQQPLISVPHT